MNTQKTQVKPSSPSYQGGSKAGDCSSDARQVASEKLQAYGSHYVSEPARDLGSQLAAYAKRKPDVAAIWCFGLGIILGWKLRG